ncbi:MAG: hypothetical protein QM621_00855 [Aeromicrobium sp.]|uniref:hypothetical protein n=1 Tax=Aeromicrobium sp. TaxID=1871063 RepID=UPI0039E566AA
MTDQRDTLPPGVDLTKRCPTPAGGGVDLSKPAPPPVLPPIPPPPARSRDSSGAPWALLTALIVVVLLAFAGVGVAVMALTSGDDDGSEAGSDSGPQLDLSLDEEVEERSFDGSIEDHGSFDLTAVETWKSDLAAGDEESLRKNCWTIAPEAVEAMYLDADVEAIDDLLNSGPPEGGQAGVSWSGDELSVLVFSVELNSPYACPLIVGDDIPDTMDAQAEYTVERLIARAQGTPVNHQDTESAYPLSCDLLERGLAEYDEILADASVAEVRPSDDLDWWVDTELASGQPGPSFRIFHGVGPSCVSEID